MNFKILPALCFIALSFLSACGDDKDTGSTPAPSATASFKATIAGSPWEATNHNTTSSGGMSGIYGNDNNGRKLYFLTSDITKTGNYTSGSMSYELTHTDGSDSRWTGFLSDSTVNVLTITSYNAASKKISGSFKFSGAKIFGASNEPDTVKVTAGTFTDLKLP